MARWCGTIIVVAFTKWRVPLVFFLFNYRTKRLGLRCCSDVRQSFEFPPFLLRNRLLAQVSLSLGSFVARQDSLFHSKFFSDYAVVWLLFCFLFSSSFKGSCWYDWAAAAAVCWADNKEQHASLSKRARNYKPRRCTWWHNSSIWMMMMFWWKPGRCPDQLLTTFQNRMMRL